MLPIIFRDLDVFSAFHEVTLLGTTLGKALKCQYTRKSHPNPYITMEVIASVEKYENAGMKFSTVPAFALAESRASDACCLFLVQKHTRAKSACFPPQESSDQVLELIADVATHSLDPRAATRAVPVRNLPAAAHAALL